MLRSIPLCAAAWLLASCKAPSTPSETDTDLPPTPWACVLDPGAPTPPSSPQIGCADDFDRLAAEPLDASIPGARSVKTALDRSDGDRFHFIDTQTYKLHWDFAFAHLSGNGLPIVPPLGQFNTAEYYSPNRRFLLGAVTYYEEPDVWAYELSPYDTSSAEMIAQAYEAIAENTWFGDELKFHATSAAIAQVATALPPSVQQITTDELFAGITYQPLNFATSMGRLAFYAEGEVEVVPPWFREIVVLEAIPIDISVTQGIITSDFQTPLSHINVLSQNRGTPNMALRGAWENAELRALEGRWVELTVGPFNYTVREVTQEEADAWWELNRPEPIPVPPMDTSVVGLRPLSQVLDREAHPALGDAISAAVPVFGGKVSHYAAMLAFPFQGSPVPDGFAIPVHHYDKHMRDNGLWDLVDAMFADPQFHADPAVRVAALANLRAAIQAAPMDPVLEQQVVTHIATGSYPTTRFRFRSSTNAEDVEGFNGAGLYESYTGDPLDPTRPVRDAIRGTWSSAWTVRAYEERTYYGIDHTNIGMAVLSHRGFPVEDSNGVAITANIFDTVGAEPAFYINVQLGDEPVVRPDPAITTDQILFYFTQPGQPIVYLGYSSLTPPGTTVLTNTQVNQLGSALQVIHQGFAPAYGNNGGFYGMDVEFKFDSQFDGTPTLYIKQARPYPGWGTLQ